MTERVAGFALRHAREADLAAIVAIYNATIPGRQVTADLEPVSVESRRPWFAAHTPDRHPLWVVEEDGQVVGWMSLSPFYGRPAYAATAELSIYLDPRVRGRGLGGALLDHVAGAAPGLGVRTLLGFIFAHNAPSLALFCARGFAEWGRLPDVAELDGVRRTLLIVGRHLDSETS